MVSQAEMDDKLAQNKPLIKRLYQKERKTLKEVKEILERDYQFPQASLSIYETRLRNLLSVRKKFKRGDWSVIYQHHLTRKKKRTALYLDGVKFPWNKAWKEIRRSGARETRIDQDTPLPDGIELRTPSPSLSAISSPAGNGCQDTSPPSPMSILPFASTQVPIVAPWTFNQNLGDKSSPSFFVAVPTVSNDSSGADIEIMDIAPLSSHADSVSQFAFHSLPSHGDNAIPMVQNEVVVLGHGQAAVSSPNFEESPRIKLMLENLPWQNCRLLSHSMVTGQKFQREFQTTKGITYSLMPRDSFCTANPGLTLARMSDTSFPVRWDIQQTVPTLTSFSTALEVSHFLAQGIYLLSNRLLYWDEAHTIKLVQGLLNYIPRGLVSALFQDDSLSIQAAWECFVDMAHSALMRKKHGSSARNWELADCHEMGRFVIEIGLQHLHWVAGRSQNKLIHIAILISNSNLLQRLLNSGACPAYTLNRSQAIFYAAEAGSVSCIKVLVKDCDLNYEFKDTSSHFIMFLEAMEERFTSHFLFSNYYKTKVRVTIPEALLEAGADVDSLYPPSEKYLGLLEQTQTPKEWYPTCLDWIFQWDRELFDRILPKSSLKDQRITRHGALLAATNGKSTLSEYIASRSPQSDTKLEQFLGLIIREQFLTGAGFEFFNIQVLKSLTDVGLQIHPSDYKICSLQLLRHAQDGTDEDIPELLNHLFQHDVVIDSEVLEAAVSRNGINLLELLLNFGAQIDDIGVPALLRAAYYGNYKAVDWLLTLGVNIRGEVKKTMTRNSTTIVGHFTLSMLEHGKEDEEISEEAWLENMSMLQYLVDRGAELKRFGHEQYASGLLTQILTADEEEDMFFLIDWLFDQLEVGTRNIPQVELQDLFAAATRPPEFGTRDHPNSLFAFYTLYRFYDPPRPARILASLIANEAEDKLIQEFVEISPDVNTYEKGGYRVFSRRTPLQAAAEVCNYGLISQLLELGADINAPARGIWGATALQAICAWNPTRMEERARQRDIVNLLIQKGADVNAAPAYKGQAAITNSAAHGDIELATVLLAHGADPNINAPASDERGPIFGMTALDAARGCDIAQLLLNAGALSSKRGSTGYEGAISEAELRGNYAVARIIREHIVQQEEIFDLNPELRACHNTLLKSMDDVDTLHENSRSLRKESGYETDSSVDYSEDMSDGQVVDFEDGSDSYSHDYEEESDDGDVDFEDRRDSSRNDSDDEMLT